MINLTALGNGYYIVSVNGVDTTQHVSEREAIESAVNQEQANPSAVVAYRHDYIVRVEQAVAPAPAPEPEPIPGPIPPPAVTIFRDTFDYIASRDDANVRDVFLSHGWSGVKTRQEDGRGNGYLYTVDAIPGYTGTFPAGPRALCIEALPGSLGGQTDFYLQLGSETTDSDILPGNMWMQFWIYINDYGDQRSLLDGGNKLLYVCDGTYPCHTGKWLMSFGSDGYLPDYQGLGIPSNGALLTNIIQIQDGQGEVTNSNHAFENRWKLGQTDKSQYLRPNQWTLVKLHVDTSKPNGDYEAWMKPMGGQWTKVVEWLSGVTPGFDWRINQNFIGGHRVLRMPTTIGS